MKSLLLLGALATLLLGCDRVKHAAKTTLRKTSETVGQSAAVVADGLATGAQQEATQAHLSPALQARGLLLGKVSLTRRDSSGARLARMTMYLIFNQNFTDTVRVKLYTQQGVEYGRSKLFVTGRRDEARPLEVAFDRSTNFELGTKVLVE